MATTAGLLLPGPRAAGAAGDSVEIAAASQSDTAAAAADILAPLPAAEQADGEQVELPAEPTAADASAGSEPGQGLSPEAQALVERFAQRPVLSLAQAVELARNNSPGLQSLGFQSQAFWEQADSVLGRGRLGSSFSILGLQTNSPLGVFAGKLSTGNVSQADFDPAHLNDPDLFGSIEYKLRLSYPLFSSQRIELMAGALRLNAEATALDKLRAQHELEGRVIETYLAHDLLEQQLIVLTDAKSTVETLSRDIHNLYDEGLVIGADLAASDVELAKLDDELNKAWAQHELTENIIGILTCTEPGFSSGLNIAELGLAAPELEEACSAALEQRPDLRAMQRRVAAAGSMLEESRRRRRPEIGAFAEGKNASPNLPGAGHTEVTVGAQLSLDLDSGGVLKKEISQHKAELSAAAKGAEQLEQQARLEVAQALAELKSALGSQDSLRAQSIRSAETLRVVNNRYHEGVTNYLDLRMALSGLKESRLSELAADYSSAIAYIHLLAATGQIGSEQDPFLGGVDRELEAADEEGWADEDAKTDAESETPGGGEDARD